MSYLQQFGVSRISPLNMTKEPTENEIKWGYKGPDGWVDGTEYTDPNSEYNTEGAGANKATDIINKNNQYSEEQLGDDGYNASGQNVFGLTKDEMKAAVTKSENSKSLDMIKGGKEWENSSYNTQPKKGYDEKGNPMTLREGDKVTFDGKVVEDKDGKKFKPGINEVQTGLNFASMVDPTGLIADGLNATISGARSVGAFARGDYEQAKKFGKEGLASTFFMLPGTDWGKVGKFNKMMSKAGKTKLVNKQPIFEKHSDFTNMARGLGNFALRKGQDTKLNKAVSSNVSSLFGGGKASQFFGKKLAENTTSTKGIKNYSKLQNSDKEKES